MNNINILFAVLTKHQQKITESVRNFNVAQCLNQQKLPQSYSNSKEFDTSLFLTNLPNKKREKRVKVPKKPIHYGSLIIECKNKALNHYSGIQYGKFDVIPLVSKGWHHRKSYGDYFSLLPSIEHPAFLTKEDLPETFKENGISEKVIQQLEKINITHPTVIQAKAIMKLLQGYNVFISAECGSGKTLAYIIAMIENILKWRNEISCAYNSPLGIILVPTRELAIQVGLLTAKLGSDLGIKCETLIGGETKNLILNPKVSQIDILTCTLRVLNKHLRAKLYSTEFCKHVVIDESDTFMDSSFIKQTNYFLNESKLNFSGFVNPSTERNAQICFVSATVPSKLEEMLYHIIKDNEMETVSTSFLHKPFTHARQIFKRIRKKDKPEELLKIVKTNVKAKIPTMIFCNRLTTSYWLYKFLNESKVECGLLSKQIFAAERLKTYRNFEAGFIKIIICTDLASRGLDFKQVKQIINYEFPTFMIDYIHRCGRTGRISQGDGCLITNLISSNCELPLVQSIEIAIRTHSTLPRIYQDRILSRPEIKKRK